jgi:ribosome biogenesis GTPase / thiamine phosphate phosphatase
MVLLLLVPSIGRHADIRSKMTGSVTKTAPFDLDALGWNQFFAEAFEPFAEQGLVPARAVVEHRGEYRLYTEDGEVVGAVTGRFRHGARGRTDFPSVGDWVAVKPSSDVGRMAIHAVLPRKSKFARKMPGGIADEQVVAANVDTVLLVTALDKDFSLHRLERYLVLAWESGASPVIVLNKADLCEDVPSQVREVEGIAPGVPIHVTSVRIEEGLDALSDYLRPGQTVALLGSSGVGKSTLINHLVGEDIMRTGDVRERDHRGRHTTTHRELILLPQGGLLMDTPGMREIQLWDAAEGMEEGFDDVEQLAAKCAFADCAHETEPRCAVQAAIAAGALSADRLESYRRLQRELEHVLIQQDRLQQLANKRRVKSATRAFNAHQPRR